MAPAVGVDLRRGKKDGTVLAYFVQHVHPGWHSDHVTVWLQQEGWCHLHIIGPVLHQDLEVHSEAPAIERNTSIQKLDINHIHRDKAVHRLH